MQILHFINPTRHLAFSTRAQSAFVPNALAVLGPFSVVLVY